ncbi:Uncharacterised protein [Mycobacterium tuberculosis]|uniref:Uncharacterized protein n=1 Tax=Mycobacterium tuberculosis TaxID=1773 RepID=A0A916LDC3_MYCTX|nr:Uncharacterised protein [Mycobacterium tuberculosis]COZ12886.1 Uncharacterised protein [Mycobacterium tuberculosis]
MCWEPPASTSAPLSSIPVQPSARNRGSASTQNMPDRSGMTNWLPLDTCSSMTESTGTVVPAGGLVPVTSPAGRGLSTEA